MKESQANYLRTLSKKECPECGQKMEEQIVSYIMECDHCLSKREE